MEPRNPMAALAPHLLPGERLVWHLQPGPAPLTRSESRALMVFGAQAGVIGTILASLADVSTVLLPLVFVAITSAVYGYRRWTERPSPDRLYAVTDKRVLIVEGRRVRIFGPDDIRHVEIETLDDGSVDLVWGSERGFASTPTQHNTGWTARAAFVAAQRTHKIGFIGLPSVEPARGMIDGLLRRHRQQVVDAVTEAKSYGASPRQADSTGASAVRGWQTVRHTVLGFAIDLPEGWTIRTATVKRIHLFWVIPFEPEPRWSEAASGNWNRLVVDTGADAVALQVSLNPPGFPARFEDTVNERLSKLLNVRTIDSSLDARIGAFSGFSVVQDLEGVGPSISFGPVTISGGTSKARLLQKQAWVRSQGLSIHVQYVVPKDDSALRAALDRVVATIRIEP
jgi:hypothetical protein